MKKREIKYKLKYAINFNVINKNDLKIFSHGMLWTNDS